MTMIILSMITTAMLTSCGYDPKVESAKAARNLPANYGPMAVAYVKAHLKDPASCTYLKLSNEPPHSGMSSRTGVFVDVNAKNSFGGYTGIQPVLVIFQDGVIVDSIQ